MATIRMGERDAGRQETHHDDGDKQKRTHPAESVAAGGCPDYFNGGLCRERTMWTGWGPAASIPAQGKARLLDQMCEGDLE